jgi:ribosomal protein S18 acetylase RimI-like enzyme
MQKENKIISLDVSHAPQIAKLHIQGLSPGFISMLGCDFVTALYEAIAQNQMSFGFVAEEKGNVLGFVAFTTNLNKLYKFVVLKKGWRFALLLIGKMFSLKRIKKVFETLFYPNRVKKLNLPSAELLSIVVAEEGRGKKLGTQLLQKGFQECQKRRIEKVKVLVGEENIAANRLYQKCGFELVAIIESHGVPSNIYVAKTDFNLCMKKI